MTKPRRSNCLIWAALLYLRRRAKQDARGGLTWRDTRLGWGPHLMYAHRRLDGTYRVVHYTPIDQTPKKLPPLLFAGRVKWGDKP